MFLYFLEARRQPDWEDFSKAMQVEIKQKVSAGIFSIVLPEGAVVIPAVWHVAVEN
jgi:hypothetical protein